MDGVMGHSYGSSIIVILVCVGVDPCHVCAYEKCLYHLSRILRLSLYYLLQDLAVVALMEHMLDTQAIAFTFIP